MNENVTGWKSCSYYGFPAVFEPKTSENQRSMSTTVQLSHADAFPNTPTWSSRRCQHVLASWSFFYRLPERALEISCITLHTGASDKNSCYLKLMGCSPGLRQKLSIFKVRFYGVFSDLSFIFHLKKKKKRLHLKLGIVGIKSIFMSSNPSGALFIMQVQWVLWLKMPAVVSFISLNGFSYHYRIRFVRAVLITGQFSQVLTAPLHTAHFLHILNLYPVS